ncbi:MAG: hypothetical protein UX31_C0040G0002 [Candidatus Nomurabacteria bacterium GW2011_GWA1_46_11]|uniref:Uncharacterized protein n=1 Tax=Candidatus Nomurabacteria bacterium GW2011_GWA1_46_11 TaxID=1618732 RepID=A0A0G1NJ03_9BACT|nr:MAG: hypothetical protein UX31_C0040G0002 [Candidatus Nomurabacteria bacterium GW2011_GWA1_46_11]
MPEITIKQKKFIEKNRYSLSINEMAKSLSLSPEQIDQYLHPAQNPPNQTPSSDYQPPVATTTATTPIDTGIHFHLPNVNFKVSDEPRIKQRYILIILIVTVILVYGNGLFGGFVSDDISAIVTNPKVGDLAATLTHPTIGGILTTLAFKLGGYNPIFYHLNNLIFHLGSVILIYFIFKLLTKKTFLPGLIALIFAIHPITTESVVWISGLPYVSYTFFGLLTLLIIITIQQKILPLPFLATAVFTFGLSFLSSEKSVAFVLIILIYLALFWSRRAAGILLAATMSMTVLFAKPLWSIFYQRILDANPSFAGGITFYNPLVQIPVAIYTYIKLFLFPINLTYYHETLNYNPVLLLYYYLLLSGLLLLGIVLYKKRQFVVLLGLVIFLLGFSPTLLPIRIAWIVAERYAYLPAIGFSVGLSYILLFIWNRNRWGFIVATAALVLMYSGLTIKRTFDWRSEETLWPATAAVSPDSTHARYNMGEIYRKKGDLKKAKEEFEAAIYYQPNNLEATNALATLNLQMGESTEAAKLFDKAKAMNPQSVDYIVSTAIAAIQQKKYDEALKLLEEAKELDPKSTIVYNALGGMYFELGDKKKAIEMLEKALEIDPGQGDIIKNLQYLKSLE